MMAAGAGHRIGRKRMSQDAAASLRHFAIFERHDANFLSEHGDFRRANSVEKRLSYGASIAVTAHLFKTDHYAHHSSSKVPFNV
jgi:hypothetical protein